MQRLAPVEALLLKLTFSMHGLGQAAGLVYEALSANKLPEAQRLASWHLVSRDTSALTEQQVAAATIESVAENTSDGVIAPMLYYLLFGLPGALVYRFVNTADSMLGYRREHYEWLGKIPARLDDALNILPARLTALLFVVASHITRNDPGNAAATWARDHAQTSSPNAGHPMSAMAGALNVSLEKVKHYTLGAGQPEPTPEDIQRSIRLMKVSVWALVGSVAALLTMRNLAKRP